MADLQARYTRHLRAQAKTATAAIAETLACPFCNGRIFQQDDQLWEHVKLEHSSTLQEFGGKSPDGTTLFKKWLKDEALRKGNTSDALPTREVSHISSDATAGGGSTPDLTRLSLLEAKQGTNWKDQSYRPGRKRAAGSDIQPLDFSSRAPANQDTPRKVKAIGYSSSSDPYIEDPDYSRNIPFTVGADKTRPKSSTPRLFDPSGGSKGAASPYMQATPNLSSEDWSVEANPQGQYRLTSHRNASKSHRHPSHGNPRVGGLASSQSFNVVGQPNPPPQQQQQLRQPGIIEIQRSDPRYPGLLLQPDSRPISQEQLASEVKSIYAGLTMVETKCIHVDRAQASAIPEAEGEANSKLANDHWQALIALHRTLLHEHHDFFLASQHPSASKALRHLASKYSMPARMWKHGIHSFLEVLRRRLPESLDYMLAFIYLAYQMMALLYETVPTFEDTWIECLGDLGRYRMAIEDEDLRDRETWAGVARFWYSKAADRSPSVGRLYHHLAILARPNALQQLYYYSRSLTCVVPFMSARESILTLLDPILGRSTTSYSHSLPVDTSFIKAHGILFGKLSSDSFEEALTGFLDQLDNHIGRVTAKWKEQGVYIAVTNLAGLFDYGSQDSILRYVFQLHAEKVHGATPAKRPSTPSEDESSRSPSPTSPESRQFSEDELSYQLQNLSTDFTFSSACRLTFLTLTLVLKRVGDKNVLPHVHVLLAFLSSLTAIPYVSFLANGAPWEEIVVFLNTLSKSERLEPLTTNNIFPTQDQDDNRPLPEDYLIRGQVWAQLYFPENWFGGEHDEEERSLELASTIKARTERILRLGHQIASYERWIHYDQLSNTWSISTAFAHVKAGHKSTDNVSHSTTHTFLTGDAMDMDPPFQSSPKMDEAYHSDDSPEMQVFQAEERSLSSHRQSIRESQSPSTHTISSTQAKFPTKAASKMLLQNYTVMVCDTDLLLKQREVFELLLEGGGWNVVVPESVIAELLILARNTDSTGDYANQALDSVRAAVMEKKKVRITTAKGNDVTRNFIAEQIGGYISEDVNNSDDIIIGVARRESDLNRDAESEAKPAVLVTEDRAMRIKAAAVGVAAIATSMIRKVLITPKRRLDSEQQPSP
ncbi:hypothetical protein K432DRAFT_406929 [Lepidopterella palustris CBS 459.81]|uniref:PIN domain-containing protein n=1 Tax=Lepidopterella palustris CBS 459.81 TaxID=1314670 RepID=A0A8E2JCU7_9PEZI|nr:hypothetical protein K432DRAFT_406929 [Lepidopterella palustris CBS 459.81]